ncbi:MAG: phosphoribosylamine--glycine ligase [Opitutales bacterium]|nr:phosphoribosylamine--glycine ligase [Opitutales bacterium]
MSETKLKTLVIGSGGREHAIVKSCLKSALISEVIAAPGNGGIAKEAKCLPLDVTDVDATVALAEAEKVDFVIVGPEVPLCLGVTDALQAKGITVYGPNKAGAQLEGSKVFTKDFLNKYKIPTAKSDTFSKGEADDAVKALENYSYPVVVKASGLAAGKGVIIAQSREEAETAIRQTLSGELFGNSGAEILIEEFLDGEESSITIMVSGENYVYLPAAQDHKRIGEKDSGPNTGGMGAYAPAAVVNESIKAQVISDVIEPTLKGLVAEGIDFRGTLFIGIMIVDGIAKVLEFNVRFGDPETQVLLPLLETDPISIMFHCAKGTLKPEAVKLKPEYAIVIVAAAKGYPEAYPKGETITLPDNLPTNVEIVHAGTKLGDKGEILSNGGRVLGITAFGKSLKDAATDAYKVCDAIEWNSIYFRRDIGYRQLTREQ